MDIDSIEAKRFVSRAGEKLQFAVDSFKLDFTGLTTADFGSSTGGFTDCMLKNGAEKVYPVDTCYGELDYGLRKNPKVIVYERNNAMHVTLPEKVDFITVDVAWTKQEKVIPNVIKNLKENGRILSLVKTNYESKRNEVFKAVVKPEFIEPILQRVEEVFAQNNLEVIDKVKSPITGKKAGNEEWLYLLKLKAD